MRIKANPTRMTKEHGEVLSLSSAAEPTTSAQCIPISADEKPKKAYSDFSISAQLKKPSKSVPPAAVNLSVAQKAYEELLRGLEKQEQFVATAMSFFNGTQPFVNMSTQVGKAALPPGSKRTTSRVTKGLLVADDSALDLSTKKARKEDEGDALQKLSSLVTTVGNQSSPAMPSLKKSPSIASDDNDPSKVFTCLQCWQSFQSMQELVHHMEKTLHFNQVNKYAANGKSEPTKEPKQHNRHVTFRFKCEICGHSSDSDISEHMTKSHSFKSPAEWIPAIKLIPI
ncbi:hypothetical protein AAVH_03803 [Aphelenchoides avenae]|nr:hypothetical protein AAVH_03803 [Aphelenchus avenae]